MLARFYAHAVHHAEDQACAAVQLRCFAERLVALVLGRGVPATRLDPLYDRMRSPEFANLTDGNPTVLALLDDMRRLGNDGAHGKPVGEAARLLQAAHYLADWYCAHRAGAGIEAIREPSFHGPDWRIAPLPKWQVRLDLVSPGERVFILRSGATTTVLSERDGVAQERWSQVPTMLFGARRQLWEHETTSARFPVAAMDFDDYCDLPEGAVIPLAQVPVAGSCLVNLQSGVQHPSSPELALDGTPLWHGGRPPLSIRRGTRSLVTVGPWHLRFDEVHCVFGGAHGGWGCYFEAFDAQGSAPDLLTAVRIWVESQPQLVDEAQRQWLAEGDDPVQSEGGGDTTPTLEIHRFECTFDHNGRLGLLIDFTGDTYYAASDGRWDEYTRSVTLAPDGLPPELEPYAQMPEAVLRWYEQHPSDFAGWSELDPALLPTLVARFDD